MPRKSRRKRLTPIRRTKSRKVIMQPESSIAVTEQPSETSVAPAVLSFASDYMKKLSSACKIVPSSPHIDEDMPAKITKSLQSPLSTSAGCYVVSEMIMDSSSKGEGETLKEEKEEFNTSINYTERPVYHVQLCAIPPDESSPPVDEQSPNPELPNTHKDSASSEEPASAINALEHAFYSPQVEIQGSRSMSDVLVYLQSQLPPYWACFTMNDYIHVVKVASKGPPLIQRDLLVSSEGQVRICIHSVELPNDHEVMNLVRNLSPLSLQTNEEFAGDIIRLVGLIRRFEICCGVYEERYKPLWSTCESGFVDHNKFNESRYSVTFRSDSCALLVVGVKYKCKSCINLAGALYGRYVQKFGKL